MANPEISGWEVELRERSPGLWLLSARHVSGEPFERADHDIDRAFQSLKDFDVQRFGALPADSGGA